MPSLAITLIGPGGAGKSTVALLLAERLRRRAVDLDRLLIPSLDRERCVAETVRRQLARPFARSRVAEEAVIKARFPLYVGY